MNRNSKHAAHFLADFVAIIAELNSWSDFIGVTHRVSFMLAINASGSLT